MKEGYCTVCGCPALHFEHTPRCHRHKVSPITAKLIQEILERDRLGYLEHEQPLTSNLAPLGKWIKELKDELYDALQYCEAITEKTESRR